MSPFSATGCPFSKQSVPKRVIALGRAGAFIRRTMRLFAALTPRVLTLSFIAAAAAATVHAQQVRTGLVAERYAQLCANCHGANLQGGQAPSMLDDVWTHGGDDESIARSIRAGFPEKGMPPWGAAIDEKEIRAMVLFIRERRAQFQRDNTQFPKPAESVTAKSELHNYTLNTWVGGLTEPWSMAFLSPERAIVTEKRGKAWLVENGKLGEKEIAGIPTVDTGGQAGLFDVVPHPNYASNGWIYFAFADLKKNEAGRNVSLTRIIRGKLRDGALVDQQDVFLAPAEVYPGGGNHFGGRIAFNKAGYLFFTIGERGREANAQTLTVPMGKVHRVHDDGRIPTDNPFVKDTTAVQSIWSFGHRNPQGLAVHPITDEVFDAEHGPRGGDELNLVRPARNYGWPVISYGMAYNGTAFPGTEGTAKEGMEQPMTYWVPSIAVCGINFYTGDKFPKWKNHLFIASLAAEELRRLEIKDGKVATQEIIFKGLGRIRHVITGPDGALYVLLNNRIARVTPAP